MQFSVDVIFSFFKHHWSQLVDRFSVWQNSLKQEYPPLNFSSKGPLPNRPRWANQTIQLEAKSWPNPIWKVWTMSGLIRAGDSAPGTKPLQGLPIRLKGLGPGRSKRQGAASSKRHHSCTGNLNLPSWWYVLKRSKRIIDDRVSHTRGPGSHIGDNTEG